MVQAPLSPGYYCWAPEQDIYPFIAQKMFHCSCKYLSYICISSNNWYILITQLIEVSHAFPSKASKVS